MHLSGVYGRTPLLRRLLFYSNCLSLLRRNANANANAKEASSSSHSSRFNQINTANPLFLSLPNKNKNNKTSATSTMRDLNHLICSYQLYRRHNAFEISDSYRLTLNFRIFKDISSHTFWSILRDGTSVTTLT